MPPQQVRVGEGAGYAGAWIEPAVELLERGNLDYLCLEALAERTIALAQFERQRDPSAGFSPLFERRMRALLGPAKRTGTKIVTNMGAANPLGAAQRAMEIARELGIGDVRVAAVTGDDVRGLVADGAWTCLETGKPVREHAQTLLSANAYIGAEPLAQALRDGADVVIAGRAGDAALHLACLEHAWEWLPHDYPRVAAGTLVGHLLECSTQITGGYFADPARNAVSGLGRCGYPIAEVDDKGACVITKVAGSGGTVTERTCKEQALYEVHDPAAYITPDVIADFSGVRVKQVGADRVRVEGASGKERPATLKVIMGVRSGFIAEGQISYGGPGAVGRARLAGEMVRERLDAVGIKRQEERADIIGVDSLYGPLPDVREQDLAEARMRYAARVATREEAQAIVDDIEALWIVGPSGGGGATKAVREVVITLSTLIPRELVERQIEVVPLW
jgi:hypothetical protein